MLPDSKNVETEIDSRAERVQNTFNYNFYI